MRSQSPRHRYCRIAISKMMVQAIERSMPSLKPRSLAETEIANRLVVAHANEAMSIARYRVPSRADRVNSLGICRHYYKSTFYLIDRT
jgi:hypothetical protein